MNSFHKAWEVFVFFSLLSLSLNLYVPKFFVFFIEHFKIIHSILSKHAPILIYFLKRVQFNKTEFRLLDRTNDELFSFNCIQTPYQLENCWQHCERTLDTIQTFERDGKYSIHYNRKIFFIYISIFMLF